MSTMLCNIVFSLLILMLRFRYERSDSITDYAIRGTHFLRDAGYDPGLKQMNHCRRRG